MKQLLEISQERDDMAIIVQLTNAFESLSSMRISQVKNQVLQAQGFFNELWNIYSQIRVDSLFRFGRKKSEVVVDKILYIIISASGGFSGDIDQRLVETMIKTYDPAKHDIIVVGYHGTVLLSQQQITYKKYFELPEHDENI